MAVETLKCYSGREGTMQFRTPASIAEMIAHCSRESHIWVRSCNGDARRVKVNGRVRSYQVMT
jgi:hypothetical protein